LRQDLVFRERRIAGEGDFRIAGGAGEPKICGEVRGVARGGEVDARIERIAREDDARLIDSASMPRPRVNTRPGAVMATLNSVVRLRDGG
jgi:hypothetical protein